MLCPNCGNDNAPGRASCAVCGRELPAARVGTFDPADAELDLLWPQETVFVLEEDVDPLLEVPGTIAQFEDAQADDVFEQSLSGVKLEDLIEEEEQAFAASVAPPPPTNEATPEMPPDEPAGPADPDPSPGTDAEDLAPLVPDRRVPEAAVALPVPEAPPPTPAPRRRPVLRALASVIVLLTAFAGGAAAGFWYASENLSRTWTVPEIPQPAGSPVPVRPAAPEGMVLIGGGNFLMGSDDGEVLSRPAHFVSLKPFFIDRTEVTNEQYRRFVEATSYDPPASWKDGLFPSGQESFPVTGITWYDAAAYAAWAGKRLPTEAEWEFAARGTEGRKYPWGNDWDPALANVAGTGSGIRPVGEGASTSEGIFDMAGNAWEWTASDARPYPGGLEFPWSRLRLKIIRGGNFKSDEVSSAAWFRGYYGASGERDYSSTSFRCVRDIQN